MPTLRNGDLAVLIRQDAYGPGEVVAFNVEDSMVIHRIVGGDSTGYILKGDNRDKTDPWQPPSEAILGRMWVRIPGAGRAVSAFRQPLVLGSVAGILGMMFVLSAGAKADHSNRTSDHSMLSTISKGVRIAKRGRHLHQGKKVAASVRDRDPLIEANSAVSKTKRKDDSQDSPWLQLLKSAQVDGRLRLRYKLPAEAQVFLDLQDGASLLNVILADSAQSSGKGERN